MRESLQRWRLADGATRAAALLLVLGACSQAPLKPSDGHLFAEPPRADGQIPEPVQVVPLLPPPRPAPRPETYSVMVHNVHVQDLLFALARDARFNVDVHPGVSGTVTLNAIEQTLPQILARIAKQVDMRYEIDGATLSVMRDTPFLRIYRVDYVNLSREARSVANLATQVSGASGGGTSGGSAGTAQNNSTAVINTLSANRFWDTLVANLRDMLRETDKVVPLGAAPAPSAAASAPGIAPAQAEFREAASVIANAEAGVLGIRATSRQHEKVREFLDLVLANAKRQVLIEATIAEVQLNNQYQRGIDWSRLRSGSAGFQVQQSSAATPAGVSTGAFVFGYARLGVNLHWVMENEGSMFLAGEARQVQTDLIDSSSGNEAAAKRMQRRVDRAMHGFKEAQRLVDEAAARCEYAMPQLFRQAVVLAVMKGMAPDAVDAVTQMLKAQALLDQRGVKNPL